MGEGCDFAGCCTTHVSGSVTVGAGTAMAVEEMVGRGWGWAVVG